MDIHASDCLLWCGLMQVHGSEDFEREARKISRCIKIREEKSVCCDSGNVCVVIVKM